jgi:hypothetical protein
MRIPFPERIPLTFALLFATVLFGVEQMQGTNILFSLYAFLFIVIATVAFNVAGGFTRPSGGYIFFYATLGVIVGLFWKAFLGEAADSNLKTPLLTMQVFLGGITSMLAAAFLSQRFSRKRALLQDVVKDKDLKNATVGCIVFGLGIGLLFVALPRVNGSLLSALSQMNRFLPMAVILGTIHQVRKSGGTSCFSFISVLAIVSAFIFEGLLTFSKQGMFTPILCFVIAAASVHYRFRIYQIVFSVAIVVLMFHFLVPYSQLGRNLVQPGSTFSENAALTGSLLLNLGSIRQEYVDMSTEAYEDESSGYYNSSQGFFDRLQMIAPDDGLISTTEQTQPFGLSPIYISFANLVPHVLWPNKPSVLAGNTYAHEVGNVIPDDDFTTGISFTPSGEAFHLARWTGVFIVAPIIWAILFIIFDSLCGDIRKSPWGLLAIAGFAHTAPEGMLSGAIYLMGYGAISIAFAALASAYVMPVIGSLLIGAERANQRRTVRLITAANRVPLRPLRRS